MKTTINISDNYKVEIDDYNHTLYSWQEAEEITVGKHSGKMSEAKWKQEGFYPNISQALRSAAQIEVLKGGDAYTLTEYAQIFENMWNKMKSEVVEIKSQPEVK